MHSQEYLLSVMDVPPPKKKNLTADTRTVGIQIKVIQTLDPEMVLSFAIV